MLLIYLLTRNKTEKITTRLHNLKKYIYNEQNNVQNKNKLQKLGKILTVKAIDYTKQIKNQT